MSGPITQEFPAPTYVDLLNETLKTWKFRVKVTENLMNQMLLSLPDSLTVSEIHETVAYLKKQMNCEISFYFSQDFSDKSVVYISCSYPRWP